LISEFPGGSLASMLNWNEFKQARPDLAQAGRELLYQFGVGLGFLGTVRLDGGPRMHPMCPVLTDDGLFALIEPGPKRKDLLRDGRYALHCFPPANNEDAFYVTGRAEARPEVEARAAVDAVFWKERGQDEPPPQAGHTQLFELLVDGCLLTRTTGHGDWNPQHTIWHADAT
jgi:hypothetical protein